MLRELDAKKERKSVMPRKIKAAILLGGKTQGGIKKHLWVVLN